MQKLVCIMTFNQVHETGVARSLLDANGIETFLKNEHLVNTVSLYSVALGGIELQVQEQDVPEARRILIENGLIKENEHPKQSFISKLDKQLSNLPFLNKVPAVYRLIIPLAILITIAAVLLFFVFKPKMRSAMVDSNWCLEFIVLNRSNYQETECRRSIRFLQNGSMEFRGFGSPQFNALWKLEGKVLNISSADTLGYKYNGLYIVDFNTDQTELKLKGPSMEMFLKGYQKCRN